jgi:glutamate-1-semialdehyde aminotransferase
MQSGLQFPVSRPHRNKSESKHMAVRPDLSCLGPQLPGGVPSDKRLGKTAVRAGHPSNWIADQTFIRAALLNAAGPTRMTTFAQPNVASEFAVEE